MKSILAYVPAGALTTPRGRLGEAGQNSRCPWLAFPSSVETAVAGIQSLKSTTIKVIRVAFPVAATVHRLRVGLRAFALSVTVLYTVTLCSPNLVGIQHFPVRFLPFVPHTTANKCALPRQHGIEPRGGRGRILDRRTLTI